MNSKLRVGVVGLGSICTEHHLPHWKSCPYTQLVAVCDNNPERVREIASKYPGVETHENWQDLVNRADLDIVDIATPNELHAPIAIMALELAKHVFCEKPMATCSVDAERMLTVARERNRRLMINHHFRFHRTFLGLKSLAARHGLGKPYYARCQWHRRRRVPVAPTFLRASLSGGGPMLDIGVHVIDLAMSLMNFPKPIAASGMVGTPLGRQSGLGGDWGDWDPNQFEVEDFGCGFIRMENGGTLFVETSWLGFHDQPEEWVVHVLGTEAGLHWPKGLYVRESDKIPVDTQLVSEDSSSPYVKSIHGFVDAIVHGKPTPIPPEESLVVVQMIEGIYASARSKREISLTK